MSVFSSVTTVVKVLGVSAAIALGSLFAAGPASAVLPPVVKVAPDLVVQQAQPRLYAFGGPTATAFVSVKNSGPGTAVASTVSVTMTPVSRLVIDGRTYYITTTFDTRPRLTGTGQVAPLPGGQSKEVSVTIPGMPGAGLYRTTACADSGSTVGERDETNNCLTTVAPIEVIDIG